MDLPGSLVVGGLTSVLGIAGVTASGCIYRVPSRPAWNTPLTLVQFNLTAAALGPLLAAALGASDARVARARRRRHGRRAARVRRVALRAPDRRRTRIELQGTARLLSTTLKPHFITRGVLLAVGGIALPLLGHRHRARGGPPSSWRSPREILGRYLFFVSVVPKHMAAPYLAIGSEAA